MNKNYHIYNGWIVNEQQVFRGGLVLRDGMIDTLYQGYRSFDDKDLIPLDAENNWILPGVIDDHVHFREPGLTHKGDIASESRAAVAGGITSFMDMPNTLPATLTQAQLEEKFQLAALKSLANYSFYLGASNSNLDEVLKTDPRRVCGIKIFLGSSTGNMLLDDIQVLRTIFSRSPLLIAVHCEDERTIQKNQAICREVFGEDPPASVHPKIRNHEVCFLSSFYAVRLAREYNTRLHILHLSTAEEVELLDDPLPLKQKRITGEVCVHYLWFSDEDYERLGNRIKWNPALKTEHDRAALLEALLQDKIDIVATDHAPHTLEEKNRSYYDAPSGAPLVQHALVAMLELYHQGKIPLEKIVWKMCHNPAVLFQIEKRGFLREGFHADVVLVSPDDPWTADASSLLYKCGWSPMEGQRFRSKVTHTFVNGNLVYEKGRIHDSMKGQRLTFNR
ncbi:MAG TPA: dihydroorotase [Bacteroidales bacterium]|nr:dihydroorotase [Bacteroidales bacterium]HRZ20270.1 dihydroorotase [Bacteroidales bacterium]